MMSNLRPLRLRPHPDALAPSPREAGENEKLRMSAMQLDARGEPLPNYYNAMAMLRARPEVCEAFAYDQMLCSTILCSALPGKEVEKAEPFIEHRPVQDVDTSRVVEWMQAAGLKKVSHETVHRAIEHRAHERAFHPIQNWLEGLTWDGVSRLDEWLHAYLGVKACSYSKAIGRMFLIALVARVMRPGCQADYLLILEGPQGAQKSTACGILGGQWFSDSLPDISAGKDVVQHLRGRWLLEISEMSAMSRAESAALKAFITRRVERYRPPYGKHEVEEPRQCLFIGSTNKSAYLKDETGGRRFWPVKCGTIDIDSLRRDRDMLFAEALWRFEQGEPWWPDREFERVHIAPQQAARYQGDVWEESVRQYLLGKSSVLIGEVALQALGFTDAKIGRQDQNRITEILEALDWERGAKDWRGNVPWKPKPIAPVIPVKQA